MRISDWSSDVCSSDLCAATNAGAGWHRWRSCSSGGLALVGDCGIGIVAGEFVEGFGQARALHPEFGQFRVLAEQAPDRSAERRFGKEWVRTRQSRWAAYN